MEQEEILLPGLPIVDPHHHLMNHYDMRYEIDDLRADMAGGHNVVATMYVECRRAYRETGDPALAPVGETELVEAIAAAQPPGATRFCAGIVAHADLTLGDAVDAVLEAHRAAAPRRFKGIRHLMAWDDSEIVHPRFINEYPGLADDPAFRRGAARLAEHGLTYDAWVYHHQLVDLARFARAVPELTIVLDHIGTPVGIGPYAGRRDAVFALWKQGIETLAPCPNVVVKLGGFTMPINGFDWHERHPPAGSEELAAVTRDWYLPVIDAFGPDRCMFESNFPMDREGAPYNTIWNSFKRITAGFSDQERRSLFHDTAARVYRLEL